MKKLELRLDDLHVDSFETLSPAAERGTVLARSAISDSTCFQNICTCNPSEGESCQVSWCPTCETCAESCDGGPCGEWCTVDTRPEICG